MAHVQKPPVEYEGSIVDHGAHTPERIVLHDTEGHDSAGISELSGLDAFWRKQDLGYGAHIAVDSDGNTGTYLRPSRIAYHVENHNTGSLGIEQVGFASFPNRIWLRRPKQLRKVAWWIAYWSQEFDIPLKKDVNHGVSTHRMQSKAFNGSHSDPGLGYPFLLVLTLAKIYKRLGR